MSEVDPAAIKLSVQQLETLRLKSEVVLTWDGKGQLKVVIPRDREVGQLRQVLVDVLLKTKTGGAKYLTHLTNNYSGRILHKDNQENKKQKIARQRSSQPRLGASARSGRLCIHIEWKPS